jgi:hypothetical protein
LDVVGIARTPDYGRAGRGEERPNDSLGLHDGGSCQAAALSCQRLWKARCRYEPNPRTRFGGDVWRSRPEVANTRSERMNGVAKLKANDPQSRPTSAGGFTVRHGSWIPEPEAPCRRRPAGGVLLDTASCEDELRVDDAKGRCRVDGRLSYGLRSSSGHTAIVRERYFVLARSCRGSLICRHMDDSSWPGSNTNGIGVVRPLKL